MAKRNRHNKSPSVGVQEEVGQAIDRLLSLLKAIQLKTSDPVADLLIKGMGIHMIPSDPATVDQMVKSYDKLKDFVNAGKKES